MTAELPHNIDAEAALLGALLLSNDVLDRVSDIVEPTHFFDPLHGDIFATVSKVVASGRAATPITLSTYYATAQPITDAMTVPQYLGRLAAMAPTTRNAPDYARTVRDLATRRALILLAEDMDRAARDAPVDFPSDTQVRAAEERLYEIADKGTYGRGSQSISKVMHDVVVSVNDAFQAGGAPRGIMTGFADLDAKLGGLHPGNLIILAGRPSMGKTALAINIATNAAKSGVVVQVDSMEMTAQELGLRALSDAAEIPSRSIRNGHITEDEFRVVSRSASTMARLPLYIDDAGGLTIGKLAARARRIKRQRGIGLLIIDYLQLMAGGSNNRVSDVTEITTGLKALAKELDIPVVALSQLSRKCEDRADKRPQLSDLRDSGSIEQDADAVLFVFREEYYVEREKPDESDAIALMKWQDRMRAACGRAEVIIGKQRHGPIGIVPMAFDGALTRFTNLARQEPTYAAREWMQ